MNNNEISFDINCKNAGISPNNGSSVTITIDDCDKNDLIEIVKDCTSLADIIDALDESEVLDYIGVSKVKEYFNLTETE